MHLTQENLDQRAIIIQIETLNKDNSLSSPSGIDEFRELVISSGASILDEVICRCVKPSTKTFLRQGKVDEVNEKIKKLHVNLIFFNHDLTPSQERNLESSLNARVLDRTGMILDIFALRAENHVGKLQVELAQLTHLSTRLVRGWSHLERQKGGIGLRAGPGEKQLETDRRLIGKRIKSINKKLEKVHKQKNLNRYSRKKSRNKLVALVGYTNSGKTTLFNLLTGDNQYSADKPFATLESVTRKNLTPKLSPIFFSDTVGFISDLPTQLIESFKATLDELKVADLLLHIVDISDPHHSVKVDQVNEILNDLDISHVPQIMVNNKIDKFDKKDFYHNSSNVNEGEIWISAKKNLGLDILKKSINYFIDRRAFVGWISLQPSLGKLRAKLYSLGCVIEERTTNSGLIQLHIRVGSNEFGELVSKKGVSLLADVNLLKKEAI